MKVYNLNWNYNKSSNERDAFHIKFENSDKASTIFLSSKYKDKLPNQVYFKANLELISKIDFPLNDLSIPVFGNKMLETINKIDTFSSILTPVVMIDKNFRGNAFDDFGILKPEILANKNFKVLTIINREDCFDYKKSIFKPSELNPKLPGYIEKLVIKYNADLPPIFRIKESPSKLLITQETKGLLELNKIKGCVFEEIETTTENKLNVNENNLFKNKLLANLKEISLSSWNQFYTNFVNKAFIMNDTEYITYLKEIKCPFWFVGKASKTKSNYKELKNIKYLDDDVKKMISLITSGLFLKRNNISLLDWINDKNWLKDENLSIVEIASFDYGNNYIRKKIMEMSIFKIY